MKLGICCNPEMLPDDVVGLDYVEGTVRDVLCPEKTERAFRERRERWETLPVPIAAVNCLFPKDIPTAGPEIDVAQIDAWFRLVCARAAEAGIGIIVYGSGGSRGVPEGFDPVEASEQVLGSLRRFGPLCAEHGVTLALEPLNSGECNTVTSVDEGARLVRAAGHPNIRLLADTYHMTTDGEGPGSIERAGELIVHAHAAEKDGRGPIGNKGEDHRPYFAALKKVGYDGGVSIEAKWRDLGEQLAPALDALRSQIAEA